MKTRISIVAFLFCALSIAAEVHIALPDSSTWSGQALKEYVGQTVVFDMPMIVCNNANGNYIVSPWRRFQPECQGVAGSDEYNETVRINSTCMFSLSGVSGYHRCGEKIYVYGKSKVDEVAAKLSIPVLAQIPIKPELASNADRGLIELYEGDFLDLATETIEKMTDSKSA